MKKNEKKVATLLMNTSEWMTAKDISHQLEVSIRSVKSYIKEINTYLEDSIFSSRKGYKANTQQLIQLFNQEEQNFAETPEERSALLLKKLIDSKRPLDLYELCDLFFVSESTIRHDLASAKEIAATHGIQVHSKSNKISIVGSEKEKRHLLSSLLNSEAADVVFSFDHLTSVYGEQTLETIREIVITTFFDYDCYTNDYLLNNIVLHISIALDRMKQNEHVSAVNLNTIEDNTVLTIATDISNKINEQFSVTYSNDEIIDLALLISSSINSVNFMQVEFDSLQEMIGFQETILLQKIIDEIKDNYFIDLEDPNFKIRFSLHIKNLLLRLRNGITVRNPMTQKIKRECPLIYNCAVNVSSVIEETTGFKLSDDEIAYLSFHFGYAIEQFKENRNKINCCLLSPVYYNMNTEILNKLNLLYADNINIQTVVTNESDLKNVQAELIISTVKLKKIPSTPYVAINPFIGAKDKEKITLALEEVTKQREMKHFEQNLSQILQPDLFFITQKQQSKQQTLQFLCQQLLAKNYCDEHYFDFVMKREKLSSTSFGKIAIPHSIHMQGLKTGLVVLINPNGIPWGNNHVNLVLLLCIKPSDKQIFHEIFDQLTDILTNDETIEKLSSATDYQSFCNTLLQYI